MKLRFFLMLIVLDFSVIASAEIGGLDPRIMHSGERIVIAPKKNGVGQEIIADATRWNFESKDKYQIFTDRFSTRDKKIVEFNNQKQVVSVARINGAEISYENESKRVVCGAGFHRCSIHKIERCPEIYKESQRLFGGNLHKMRECANSLSSLKSAALHDSATLSENEITEMTTYYNLVGITDNVEKLKKAKVINSDQAHLDMGAYGVIFGAIDFCKARSRFGPKQTSTGKSQPSTKKSGAR